MRRAAFIALAAVALVVLAGPAPAVTRDSYESHELHARWARITFAAGGSQRTVTVADVHRFDEDVWIDLVVTVEHCTGGGSCSLLRRGEGFSLGVPDDLDATTRLVRYSALASVAWSDAAGLPLSQTIDAVDIAWDPAGRLERTASRTTIGDCDTARSRTYTGPAVATGSVGTEPLGDSLDATISLGYVTQTFRDC